MSSLCANSQLRWLILLRYSAVVAALDEEKDSTINYNDIRAEPLAELRY